MPILDDEGRFSQAIGCISSQLYRRLVPLSSKLFKTAMEIRLRVNRPLAIVCSDITYFVTKHGGLSNKAIQGSMLLVSRSDITDTFHNICNYSVYSRQNEIINGFVTMHGGHRAGICGTAVCSNGSLSNIRDISSINIRIAREHRGCSKALAQLIGSAEGGALICGAPCSGKTTVLRDYSRYLSTELCKNVALIDERGELAGTAMGVYQNDIGFCDVYDGYKKSEGMMHALRSMAPDVIICDEIGSDDDTMAIEHALNCGVSVIATVHSANVNELKRKYGIQKLLSLNAFSKIVFLKGKSNAGEISRIMNAGDLFAG